MMFDSNVGDDNDDFKLTWLNCRWLWRVHMLHL